MSIEQELAAVAATEVERMAYLTKLVTGRDTAGPLPVPFSTPIPHAADPEFVDGFYSGAKRVDIHPGRMGGHVDCEVVVDHTADMHPDDGDALVHGWQTTPGDGAGAHFLVMPTEAQGIIQFTPITRNGNHVGGKTPPNGHGWFLDGPNHIHPNLLAIGIEFMSAGGQLRMVNGSWRFVEDGKIHGRAFADFEVEPDPLRPGRGWQKLTTFQVAAREKLHAALGRVLKPTRPGLRAVSTGEAVPTWAIARSVRFIGHVDLDPTNRSDPWPNGMRALR